MVSGIMRRVTGIIIALLRRLLPAELRRSVGWQLASREQYRNRRLMRNLLAKADHQAPYAGKRILLWELGGWPSQLIRDAVFATSLRIRGAETHLVVCDGAASACIQRQVTSGEPASSWSKKCPDCLRVYTDHAAVLNLTYDGIGKLVPKERRSELRALAQGIPADELATFRHREVEVGRLAISSLLRYLKGIPIEGYEDIAREYLYTSLVNTEAAITAIARFKPERLLMSHACYVDYGPALSVAMNAGIPVVSWMGGYMENYAYIRTIPKGRNMSHHTLSDGAWQQRQELPLTPLENERLDSYLNARYTTDMAFDLRLSSLPATPDELYRQLDLSGDKPVWCIFAHLSWDNVFNYAPMAFDTPELWLLDTIRTITEIPEVTWLVKIHPAETHSGTAYGMQSLIKDNLPELPPHVRVIPADSDINIYGLYPITDGGVTLYGTPGLEMALLGKPVILAGETHYGNKGFTYDALTKEDYEVLLRRAARLPKLSTAQQSLARQYAYSHFIQRLIPLRILKKGYKGSGPPDYQKLDLLLPGKDKVMDMICERIIDGGDFIMDEDMVAFYSALK